MKKFVAIFCILFALHVNAQELQAKVSVMANQVSTQVDKKVFQTLQNAIHTFLNNRKWGNDNYQGFEKIRCNFLLTINQDLGQNVFKASLMVQAARPVYNSTYESPIINFQDNDVAFRYVEFQPFEFNENRIQGTDPIAANLTAILAYYVNLILGMDYDSFAPRGGDVYFQKALNIVNNAPESRDISGWKSFDGMRNRFRLIENLTDNRFALVHNAIYSYYRGGLDRFFENESVARASILSAINNLNIINQQNPNSMIMQFFFQGKSAELVKMFSKSDPNMKQQARDLLTKLDITNASAYKELK